MAIEVFETNSSYLAKEKLIRCNYKTISLSKKIEKYFYENPTFERVGEIFNIVSGYAFKSEDYVSCGVPLIRIGDLNDDLVLENTVNLPDEYLEIFSKYKIKQNDILVSLTGDGRLKSSLIKIDNLLLNQRVGALKAKKNCNVDFYYYLLNNQIVKMQFLWCSNGKTQLNISPFDFLNIKLPFVSKDKQIQAIEKIKPIEQRIRAEKERKKPVGEIVDEVLARKLNLNVKEAQSFDKIKTFSMSFNSLDSVNFNLRFSYRWNKLQRIQDILLRDVEGVTKFGKYIYSTKNGWSPACTEDESAYKIVGIDSINRNGILSFDNPKFTNETRNNIDDFIIKEGDFFISRGNTTDLVALASIAPEEIVDDYIYPDLMIKIQFNQKAINKEYLAYIINSVVGRLYFKYAAKGKNQTMVKVSSTEIYDFLLPIPEISLQELIVAEIKVEIDKQDEITKQIAGLRRQIDDIVEKAIWEG